MRKAEDLQPSSMNFTGVAARLYWLSFGNLFLVAAAFSAGKRDFPSIADLIYLLVALSLGFVRYLDVTRLNGLTAEGERATGRDLRRYLLMLAPAALVLWGVGHLVGNAMR